MTLWHLLVLSYIALLLTHRALLADLASALAALAMYGGGVRRLTGRITWSDEARGSSYRGEAWPDGNQQPESGAADGCRTLPRAVPQIESMMFRLPGTLSSRWALSFARPENHETLSAISLCRNLRALHLDVQDNLDLEKLEPLRALAMLTYLGLTLEDGDATSVWSLSALLQLLPVGQAILLKGPGLAFDLPAHTQSHPLRRLTHSAGGWVESPNLVLPPQRLCEAGWERLKGLRALEAALGYDGLQQVCDSLTALESLDVRVENPQNLDCIAHLTCLTNLSLTYSNDCSPGNLSALTNLKTLYLDGRFANCPAGLSCAAQLTKLSMHALVPSVNVSVMALTALQTLELGNSEGGRAVDANDANGPTQPQPMDLRDLGLDSLKHLRTLGLFGCSFALSSGFLNVSQQPFSARNLPSGQLPLRQRVARVLPDFGSLRCCWRSQALHSNGGDDSVCC